MVNYPPMPPPPVAGRPPAPPNQPYNNSNGSMNGHSGVDQAQSSMANMNLHSQDDRLLQQQKLPPPPSIQSSSSQAVVPSTPSSSAVLGQPISMLRGAVPQHQQFNNNQHHPPSISNNNVPPIPISRQPVAALQMTHHTPMMPPPPPNNINSHHHHPNVPPPLPTQQMHRPPGPPPQPQPPTFQGQQISQSRSNRSTPSLQQQSAHVTNINNNAAMPPPPPPSSMPHNFQQHNMQQNAPMPPPSMPPAPPQMNNNQVNNSYPIPPMPSQVNHHQQQSYPPMMPPTAAPPQHQMNHQNYPMQHQQQQYPHPPNNPIMQQQQQEQNKIDPSQIPRIPLFTRPHSAPSTIYTGGQQQSINNNSSLLLPPPSDSRYVVSNSGAVSSSSGGTVNVNVVNPRIMRSTVHTFPLDNATYTKCGDVPLGLCITPLGVLTTLCGGGGGGGNERSGNNAQQLDNNGGNNGHVQQQNTGGIQQQIRPGANTTTTSQSTQWNGREQADIYGHETSSILCTTTPNGQKQVELDYIPLITTTSDDDESPDPERIPVIRGTRKIIQDDPHDGNSKRITHAISTNPPRCSRCAAYLNPYCSPSNPSTSISQFRGIYSPTNYYNCSICGASKSIELNEESISNGIFDVCTRVGTVEYEVGGEYEVRKEGGVRNVHLYGVEYVSESSEGDNNNNNGHNHHHYHGQLKSHGWQESLAAIRSVGVGLAQTSPPIESVDDGGGMTKSEVRVGIFAFYEDRLIFPYLKRRGHTDDDDDEQEERAAEKEEELVVAIVNDVTEDPFSPLPLHIWTYNVGAGMESVEFQRFSKVLDSFSELMESLECDNESQSRSGQSNNNSSNDSSSKRNCGGAALAALADALHDSGGRATLITTRRPNYGVGALRDRETKEPTARGAPGGGEQQHHPGGPGVNMMVQHRHNHQQQQTSRKESPYRRPQDEKRLFTPIQHLDKLTKEGMADRDAATFYTKLGETCAAQRICIDIVVTSSTIIAPIGATSDVGSRAIHPNPREFVDVPTLAELCRVTCGKFKWLRVGNECGVVVGDGNGNQDDAFTSEQLREELKRSALSYMGSDAVFKLRCSNGVQVKSYSPALPIGTLIGDGIVSAAELELSSINSATTIAVLLEHKVGGVQDTRSGQRRGINAPMVFFQSAVLYTTLTGKRRVRVSTMGLETTKVPADVFRSADLGTIETIMTRQAISDLEDPNEGSLHNARSNVVQNVTSLLANYRMHTSARMSPVGQLILPESLQLLPLFCLSLRKSRMLRNSNIQFKAPFPTADERAYHIFYGRMVQPNMSLHCVHPNLLQVSDMRTRDGEWIVPEQLQKRADLSFAGEEVIAASMRPVCQLPRSMNPSIACLDEQGIYILDDRFAFYLFIGKDVQEEKWQELLSVSAPSGVNRVGGQWISNVPTGELKLASTESGHKLRNILHQLRMLNSPNSTLAMNARHTYAPLILVFVGRGSVFEEEMDSLLVDDPVGNESGYVDFLCELHQLVRKKVDTIK